MGHRWSCKPPCKTLNTAQETSESLGTDRIFGTRTFASQTRTRFGTWNIRTLLQTSRLAQVTQEFRQYKLTLLGLSEIRWQGTGEQTTLTGETIIYSGCSQQESGKNGVAFLLNAEAKSGMLSWNPVSDRIITARFRTSSKPITFVQVYAPTEQANYDDKEIFYNQLEHTIRNIAKSDILVVMGDLNAKVGNSRHNWEAVIGPHGIGDMNENGELFADFCNSHELIIGGTFFQHKTIHKVTWVSPDKNTQNQIDHIAIKSKWRTSLLDVRNKRGADVFSDHHLLIGTLQIKFMRLNRRVIKVKKKFNITKLKDRDTLHQYTETVANKAQTSRNTDENKWGNLKNIITSAAEQILGYTTNEKKEWISNSTWEMIQQRKRLKALINNSKTLNKDNLILQYNSLNKKVRVSARRDRRKYLNEIADAAQKAVDMNNLRETYRLTKKIANKHKILKTPILSKDGNLLTTEIQQLNRWTEYFQDLLNNPSADIPLNSDAYPNSNTNFDIRPPNITEITEAIKNLKTGKAAGYDGIPAELFKSDPRLNAKLLLPILEDIWIKELLPPDLNNSLIVKIPKKGNTTLCSNWRGITVLNVVNKILTTILHRRIANKLESRIRKEQAGFRKGRSTIDHINTLRIIVEQSIEFQSPLYVLFVDFYKAFDSIKWTALWQILQAYSIPEKLINIIRILYTNATYNVVHNGQIGDNFTISTGVKQGCVLSPFLFILVLDWIMDKVNIGNRGIQWTLYERLEDLDFADDLALLAHKAEDLKYKIEKLSYYANQVGLKINAEKTKIMKIGTNARGIFTISNVQIEEVQSFCYLGSYITKDGGTERDVTNRIQKARIAYGELRSFWNSSVSRNLKLRIFKTNCLSVLLYGCETWKLSKSILNKLQVFTNRCLRRILNIFWPNTVTNEELWRKAKLDKVSVLIRRRKWNWIGHTLRKPPNDIARTAIEWNPQGHRRRGRPRHTWRRSMLAELTATGKTWSDIKTLAGNRVRWRAFIEDLCSLEE